MKNYLLIGALCCWLIGCKDKTRHPIEQKVVEKESELAPTVKELLQSSVESAADGTLDSADLVLRNPGLIQSLYSSHEYEAFWSANGAWEARADSMVTFLASARHWGLLPEHYNHHRIDSLYQLLGAKTSTSHLDATAWTRADLLLTDGLLQIIKHLKVGRLQPDSLLAKNRTLTEDFFRTQFEKFGKVSCESFVQPLEPTHPGYVAIRKALPRFLATANLRGYTRVNRADSARFPEQLTKRLAEDSIIIDYKDSASLASGLKSFQLAHGLKGDGKLGPDLMRALNGSDRQKFIQAAITMDRYKSMEALPSEYIWVNIPAYELRVMDADSVVLTSRVVVGRTHTRTPQLQSSLTDMITYPQWTIPASIIKKEILPALKRDPGYLARKGFSLSDWEGNSIDPYSVNWSKYNSGIPYRVVQGSGDANALGVIKFNFPNKHSVYLHDTNLRSLFKNEKRALSHGCVRVQNWEALAMHLLQRDSMASKDATPTDSVQAWLARKEKHVVPLRKRMPLYIRYHTCEAKGGRLLFFDDIYAEETALRNRYFSQN